MCDMTESVMNLRALRAGVGMLTLSQRQLPIGTQTADKIDKT